MKRYMLLLATVLLLIAWTKQNDISINKTQIDTKVESAIHATIVPFSFNDAMEQADLIAKVIFKEKVAEITEDELPYTIFRAEIIDSYGGQAIPEVITIKQQGIEERKVNNIRLFKTGEKYIFFLKETKAIKSDYWILGEETGFFKVVNSETIVKLRQSIPEFNDVEMDQTSELSIRSRDLKNAIEEQIIDKQKFIEKLNNKR